MSSSNRCQYTCPQCKASASIDQNQLIDLAFSGSTWGECTSCNTMSDIAIHGGSLRATFEEEITDAG